MLKFHGIHFVGNIPTRFEQHYDLQASLKICVAAFNHSEQIEQRIEKLNQQITDIYSQYTTKLPKNVRWQIAKISRAKDMLGFLCKEPTWLKHKQVVAAILLQNTLVEVKWQNIQLYLQKLLQGQKSLALDLVNPNAEIYQILQFVQLLFLDQIDEVPPPNLVLKFISNEFPKHNWLSTDEVGNVRLLNWLPQNVACNLHYLILQVALDNRRSSQKFLTDIPQLPKLLVDRLPQLSDQAASQPPDEIHIKYQPLGDAKAELLPLLEKTSQQSLVSFQNMIRKDHGEEGVRHLLAILKQLASARHKIFDFDAFDHLKLLSKINKNGKFPAKQIQMLHTILDELQSLQVCRHWGSGRKGAETQTPFVCKIGTSHAKEPQSKNVWKIQLLLDKIFFPANGKQYNLGKPLQLIPDAAFQENPRQHPELLLLLAYFSNCWLHEYSENQGSLNKTAEQIIQESKCIVSTASKYRNIHKLKANLYYMKEKKYIGKFVLKVSPVKNPLKDEYVIKISKAGEQLMQQTQQQISA